jgi:hypothetical protein
MLKARFMSLVVIGLLAQRMSASLIGYLGQALFPCLFWVFVTLKWSGEHGYRWRESCEAHDWRLTAIQPCRDDGVLSSPC